MPEVPLSRARHVQDAVGLFSPSFQDQRGACSSRLVREGVVDPGRIGLFQGDLVGTLQALFTEMVPRPSAASKSRSPGCKPRISPLSQREIMLRCTARCRVGFSMVCNAANMVRSSQMVRSSVLILGLLGESAICGLPHSTAYEKAVFSSVWTSRMNGRAGNSRFF